MILVTGGAGFVGSNLVDALISKGHDVIIIDNLSTGKEENINPKAQFIYHNVEDFEFDRTDWRPDVIFHIAALARIQPSFQNPPETFKSNCMATMNILEFARQSGAKVVYPGSSSAYHDIYANPYTFTKWAGEEQCKLYNKVFGIPIGIARFFNVYGPRQIDVGAYATVIGIFEKQRKEGKPLTITGNGEQRRDFCVTGDSLVLMSDFTWKQIKDIKIGENVVSFGEPVNKKRFFEISPVTATSHYESKDVYEIETEDGIVRATGNHPWLMDRRGFRDTSSLLRSLNKGIHPSIKTFSKPVEYQETKEYKTGYLIGSLDGDGYHYIDKNNNNISGLEVVDFEFSERFEKFANEFDIHFNRCCRQPSYKGSKLSFVVKTGKKENYALFQSLIQKADWHNLEFNRGYLAAIFDGEGEYDSYNNKTLRISNKDIAICDKIRIALKIFNFKWSEYLRKDGLIYFRLLGGLNEEIRFLATTQPAIKRKSPKINNREVKGKLSQIISIKKLPPSMVYNIEVANTHTYIANGYLCHNTHVHDIVAGLVALSEKDYQAEIFNFGTGTNYSINEVAAVFGGPIEYIPKRPGEAWETLADIKEAKEKLGYNPHYSLENYIKENK